MARRLAMHGHAPPFDGPIGYVSRARRMLPATPAKAGVQLGDVGGFHDDLPTWTPAFAGVAEKATGTAAAPHSAGLVPSSWKPIRPGGGGIAGCGACSISAPSSPGR